jgi:hypothetical protein
MEVKNQRGQMMMEAVLMLLMFTAMLTAIQTMANKQRQLSNKYKLSESIGAK